MTLFLFLIGRVINGDFVIEIKRLLFLVFIDPNSFYGSDRFPYLVFPFWENLAIVKYNSKVGFIDKTGKEIIPFIYEMFMILMAMLILLL